MRCFFRLKNQFSDVNILCVIFTFAEISGSGVILHADSGVFEIKSGQLGLGSLNNVSTFGNESLQAKLTAGTLIFNAPTKLTLSGNGDTGRGVDTFTSDAFVDLQHENAEITLQRGLNEDSIVNFTQSNFRGIGRLINFDTINITSDESVFSGYYEQNGIGRLNVASVVLGGIETSKVFSGRNVINSGFVYIDRTLGIDYDEFKLGNNVEFHNKALDYNKDGGNINNDVITFFGSGSKIIFELANDTGDVIPRDKRVNYTLEEDIFNDENDNVNTVRFEDSYVTVKPDETAARRIRPSYRQNIAGIRTGQRFQRICIEPHSVSEK